MFNHIKRALICILALFVIAACTVVQIDPAVEQTSTTEAPTTIITETSSATESATPWGIVATPIPELATEEPAITPTATATAQPTPKPQVTVIQQPTAIPQLAATAILQPACSLRYFFDLPAEWAGTWRAMICPENQAVTTNMAEQRFQHGRMLWVEATNSIYVLWEGDGMMYNNNHFRVFSNTWRENEPPTNLDLNPPEGYQAPIRGFGKVWAEDEEVHKNLGWAIEQERSFEGIYQRGQDEQYTHQVGQEGKTAYRTYLRTDNNEIIAIHPWPLFRWDYWEYVYP